MVACLLPLILCGVPSVNTSTDPIYSKYNQVCTFNMANDVQCAGAFGGLYAITQAGFYYTGNLYFNNANDYCFNFTEYGYQLESNYAKTYTSSFPTLTSFNVFDLSNIMPYFTFTKVSTTQFRVDYGLYDNYNDEDYFYYTSTYNKLNGDTIYSSKTFTSNVPLGNNNNSYWYGYWVTLINSLNSTDNYEFGYEVGYNTGKKDGVSEGLSSGYSQGYADGSTSDQRINSIFTGILSVGMLPINFFLSIFDFEILGINLASFVSALLSVCIVIIVTRTLKGGGSQSA